MGLDVKITAPNAKNVICTKYGEVNNIIAVAEFHAGSNLQKHFKAAEGFLGWGVAYCKFVKYTACRSNKCAVKKHVWCSKVCKYSATGRTSSCRADLCKGSYGQVACQHTATSV